MRPNDVRECAAIIAEHPVLGPRYGADIRHLAPAWLRLLGSEGAKAAVFEEVSPDRPRREALPPPKAGKPEGHERAPILGLGFAVFVSDAFMQEIKTPPLFWIGPELARRVMSGNSPALSDQQVREANSTGDLNLMTWEAGPACGYETRADLLNMIVSTFIRLHRGYRLKEIIGFQADNAQRLRWALDLGGVWNASAQRYMKSPPGSVEEVCREPHIVGITREFELDRPGSHVGSLFYCEPPRFGFSRSEQELLLAALDGEAATDRELPRVLHVSLSVVKKTWLSIYRRVASSAPDLIQESHPANNALCERGFERGKEKRRRMLAYLREHPEELRPFSRKLLRDTSEPRGIDKHAPVVCENERRG